MFELKDVVKEDIYHGPEWYSVPLGKNVSIEVPVMTSDEDVIKYKVFIGKAYLIACDSTVLINSVPITSSVKYILVIGDIGTDTQYYVTQSNKYLLGKKEVDCYLVFESAKDCAEYRLRH